MPSAEQGRHNQVLREQYISTYLEYTAVSEKYEAESSLHSAVMQVTNVVIKINL